MVNEYFKQQNVLNGLDLDKPIYKYIPLKYVLAMFKTKELYMGKVKNWEDTYENFFLKQDFRVHDKILRADHLSDQIYGQSWTLLNESDAMWRIYSNIKKINEVAIKVKTTSRKLFDAIYTDDKCMATTSIGLVKYYYKNELIRWLKNLNLKGAEEFGKHVVPSMYIKRKPFAHELEVRPIVFLDHDAGAGLSYDIDPSALFDEFVIDPRLDKGKATKVMTKLLKAIGDPQKVKQSSLYTFTPNVIQFK